MPETELIENIQFCVSNFLDNPIKAGALQGELNVELARETILEIAGLLHNFRNKKTASREEKYMEKDTIKTKVIFRKIEG